jgi:hypothetical protein
MEPTMDTGEIQFQLTFIENPKNKDIGTLQVHYIEGKAIYHGKQNVDALCKGYRKSFQFNFLIILLRFLVY